MAGLPGSEVIDAGGLGVEEVVLELHQGVDMGRPGELRVELYAGDARVRVSGTATRLPQADER
ncbi:hypothetical protein RM812_00215 [Streptomyces sp. DSM 40712]|uniref:Uncharacterized protein n=1 Tax=Streptomyces lancefieldiae TaxID=3075520 RepID=A0ABU3AER3_9ACTN|nr:hypothetical protein [Streptomyces sp. DSM 40712]MDT0608676.1 hypothetical protein [Streptomyces sp. DSM 40712]